MAGLYETVKKYFKPAAILTGAAIGLSIPLNSTLADDNKAKEVKVENGIANVNSSTTPHYLENLVSPKDSVDRVIELRRIVSVFANSFAKTPFIDGNITKKVTLHDKVCEIYFHNYVRELSNRDGKTTEKIFYYNATGKRELSKEQFQAVESDIVNTLTAAVEQAYEYHKGIQENDRVISGIQKYLVKQGLFTDKIRLKDILQNPVPEDPKLTIADVLGIPSIRRKDFVPRQLHFSALSHGILGITYLNTGVVGYHPLARQMDFIVDHPDILAHELTHNNPELQGIPKVWHYDAEVHATMVMHPGIIHFLRHSYLEDIRKMSRVLFSFDSEKVVEDIVRYSTDMGIKLDRKKTATYLKHSDKIFKLLSDTYVDFLAEFHIHQDYWTAINKELGDDNAAFRVFTYLKFEPTLLDKIIEVEENGKKVRKNDNATYKFIQEHRGVIKEAAKKARKELDMDGKNAVLSSRFKGAKDFYDSLSPKQGFAVRQFLKTIGFSDNKNPKELFGIIDDLIRAGVISKPSKSDLERFLR